MGEKKKITVKNCEIDDQEYNQSVFMELYKCGKQEVNRRVLWYHDTFHVPDLINFVKEVLLNTH